MKEPTWVPVSIEGLALIELETGEVGTAKITRIKPLDETNYWFCETCILVKTTDENICKECNNEMDKLEMEETENGIKIKISKRDTLGITE